MTIQTGKTATAVSVISDHIKQLRQWQHHFNQGKKQELSTSFICAKQLAYIKLSTKFRVSRKDSNNNKTNMTSTPEKKNYKYSLFAENKENNNDDTNMTPTPQKKDKNKWI